MSFCRLVVHLGFRFTFLKDNVIQFRLEITAFHLWAVAYFWRAFVLNILNSTVPERTVNIVISELMKTIAIDHNQYKDKFVMVCSPIANFVIIMSAACSVENWDDKASVVYILCQVIFFISRFFLLHGPTLPFQKTRENQKLHESSSWKYVLPDRVRVRVFAPLSMKRFLERFWKFSSVGREWNWQRCRLREQVSSCGIKCLPIFARKS